MSVFFFFFCGNRGHANHSLFTLTLAFESDSMWINPPLVQEAGLCSFFFFCFFYRSSLALHRRSSTSILPHNWGTFCAGVYPMCVFSFLVAAGFEPMYFSLGSEHLIHYPSLTPQYILFLLIWCIIHQLSQIG